MLRYKHLTASTLVASSGGATLWAVAINKVSVGSTVSAYNGTDATGDLIAQIDSASGLASLWYGAYCPNGIYIAVAGGTPDVTISYR